VVPVQGLPHAHVLPALHVPLLRHPQAAYRLEVRMVPWVPQVLPVVRVWQGPVKRVPWALLALVLT
jgi:hypothetical protein